ncbi:MAG: Histidinol-phosphate aminotransferase [Bacteroidota bacterium]
MELAFKGLDPLVRHNIKQLQPYSSARHEFTGKASVFLDANENSFGSPANPFSEPSNYNRYPDPLQWQLKFQLTRIKGVPAENIFIGNGSDEVIDLAYRIFCNPGIDNVIVCPPTYGMYKVSAAINDVEVRTVPLTPNFQLDVDGVAMAVDEHTKLIFICSPNNPTGNCMNREDVEMILNNFAGIVVIDEAYINYARHHSFIKELLDYPNLIVMQTLSKAWGMAALRLGLCYASMDVIDLFNNVKPPYNVNEASQTIALEALKNTDQINTWIKAVLQQRDWLVQQLRVFKNVIQIFPSEANFILVQFEDGDAVYNYLAANGIVVRNRGKELNCNNCLRITVGTEAENKLLIQTLEAYVS